MQRYRFGIDIDGTITNEQPFSIQSSEDSINKIILSSTPKHNLNSIKNRDLQIYLITGRQEKYRRSTIRRLQEFEIPFEKLIMVPNNSYTGFFNEEIYLKFKLNAYLKYHIHFALDDDIKVVNILNKYNIKAVQVNGDLKEAFDKLFVE